jgi:hypothetical protein
VGCKLVSLGWEKDHRDALEETRKISYKYFVNKFHAKEGTQFWKLTLSKPALKYLVSVQLSIF